MEQERQRLLQEFSRELSKSKAKLRLRAQPTEPRPKPSGCVYVPVRVPPAIKDAAGAEEKGNNSSGNTAAQAVSQEQVHDTDKLQEEKPVSPVEIPKSKPDREVFNRGTVEQNYYFKKLESDIADISSEIYSQQQQINRRIDEFKVSQKKSHAWVEQGAGMQVPQQRRPVPSSRPQGPHKELWRRSG